MIKMIILDLDKTLLSNNGYITKYSEHIILKCRLLGIHIVIATARSIMAAKYAIKDLMVDAIVCNDGAQILMEDKQIENPIINNTANSLLNQLSQDKTVEIIKISTKFGEYANIENIEKNGVKYLYWYFKDSLPSNIFKIMIQTTSDFLLEQYQKYSDCSVKQIRESNNFIITNVTVDKINAIKLVAHHFSLSIGETLAFGDDINDKGMLESCGVGVAMNNANCIIKEIADFVCDSNQNDGVAKWIERNLLAHRTH